MWRYTLLGGHALIAAGSRVIPHDRRVNSSLIAPLSSSPDVITLQDYEGESSTARSLSSPSTSPGPPHFILAPSEASPPFTLAPSQASPPFTNATSSVSSALHIEPCTGCAIQAYKFVTTSFEEENTSNPWTSVVVTETIVTQFITYYDRSSIDTIVTERQTVNQTKTVIVDAGEWNQTITHATPTFVVEPTPGMYITLTAGPIYLIYDDLAGGLDEYINSTYAALNVALQTCAPYPTNLKNWQPTATEDWNYFIQTYTGEPAGLPTDWPVPLPSTLLGFLKQNPDIMSQYHGSDIATCTVYTPHGIAITPGDPDRTILPKPTRPPPDISSIEETTTITATATTTATSSGQLHKTEPTAPAFPSVTTGTFISTTYESTSTHITRQGCLRCANTKPNDNPTSAYDVISNKMGEGTPSPTSNPVDKPDPNQLHTAPSIPDIIISIIYNNPSIWSQQHPPAPTAGQSITIGDHIYPIHTADPTQNNPDQPNQHNQATPPAIIIIGTETLYPGQTKTINGIPVIAPTDTNGENNPRLIVDGTTIPIPITNPSSPASAPILTFGSSTTITANPSGAFVIGSSTLAPGGPAITVSGTTYSLVGGESSGTLLVVNGQTTTLAYAAAAGSMTTTTAAAPDLTIDGITYTATTIYDGTTAYVIAPGTTLTPGGPAVTLEGTTYSLDTAGTALVVNGQTSSVLMVPGWNSASTTTTAASSGATTAATTTATTGGGGRHAGDVIASGIGESSKGVGVAVRYGRVGGGINIWIEGLVVGVAGWLLLLL